MSFPFVQNAFSAGVLAPAFYGRNDLDKYDLGLAEAINFFVDFRGGIRNRPGTRYDFEIENEHVRLFRFEVLATQDHFLLVFTNNLLRVFQAGQQVLDGMTPLEIVTPWLGAELDDLYFSQDGLVLTITLPQRQLRELTYDPETEDWTLEAGSTSPTGDRPAGLSAGASAVGPASVVFAVSAVLSDGTETLPSRPRLVSGIINYTVDLGFCEFSCNYVDDAVGYRFYRSVLAETDVMTIAQEVGFIGESPVPVFLDANMIPDFTRKPMVSFDPVVPGQVLSLTVTAPGSGYDPNLAEIDQTGAGSGFIGWPVVRDGEVIDVMVLSYGRVHDNTTAFTVDANGGGGSGATLAAPEIGPEDGTHPHLSARFQQRRILASSDTLPTAIFGSSVGSREDFGNLLNPVADGGYAIYADAPSPDPFSALVASQDALLLFHPRGVSRLRGTNGPVSALDFQIEPQSGIGAAPILPAVVGNDVVYLSARGNSLHVLTYTESGYATEEISVLAGHYFERENPVVQLAWIADQRLLWALRADGTLLSLTFLREQQVVAWTEHRTNGRVLDICAVHEETRDVLYLAVERQIAGVSHFFIEAMMERREEALAEEGWFLDCALETSPTPFLMGADFIFDPDGDGVVIEARSSAFGSASVGDIIRAFDGIFEILEVNSVTIVTCSTLGSPRPDRIGPRARRYVEPEKWSIATPFTTVSGLEHLEGKLITVLADGVPFHNVPVEDGEITLAIPATLVRAGLPYTSSMKTLPLSSPEFGTMDAKRRPAGAAVRTYRSRGLEIDGYTIPLGTWEYGSILRSGVEIATVDARWLEDQQLEIVQPQPLAAEILGLVTKVDS